jgi:hypothetical protein
VTPATVVVGRVRIGALSSVWDGGVPRGDEEEVVIGEDTNVQDFSMRVSARWRINERFRARGTKSQVLMPTRAILDELIVPPEMTNLACLGAFADVAVLGGPHNG